MLYINSFIIKQRKKEFGLYGILGLEKRHIGHVMLWENLFINGSAILVGIATACVFGWMIFMLLLKSMKVSTNTYFVLPLEAFVITFVYFLLLFFIIFILNLLQVRMANPIDLLKSDHQGEKKARFLIPVTLIGAVALGYAYYISLNVKNPLLAFNKFFFAVVLVIFATYALFTSGSVTLLKMLKKNKKYYYKPDNFISVAGMFHRMKQNAAGLASICILSTMVLVTVSTCVALFLGQEETLTTRNKDDIKIMISEETTDDQILELEKLFEKTSQVYGVNIESKYRYFTVDGMLIYQNHQFTVPEKSVNFFEKVAEDAVEISCLTLEDYNRINNSQEQLGTNQLILLSNGDYKEITEVTVGDRTFKIMSHNSDTVFTNGKNRKSMREIYLITKDTEELNQLVQSINPNALNGRSIKYILNIDANQEASYRFVTQVKNKYKEIVEPIEMDDIYTNRTMGHSIFGGLLFMGAFYTVLFLCATILIIYFKQISEGYEDKERFEMLQKVGMDYSEVKRTINKQILIVFFLPLIGALLHVAMATNMIVKLLEVFMLFNTSLTIACIVGSSMVFMLVYVTVYRLTARTYCQIVKW